MDLQAVALDDVLFQVRRDLAQLECRLAGAGPGGIAQRHANAREQLADAEGLGDIVVRAGVERLDLRALLRAPTAPGSASATTRECAASRPRPRCRARRRRRCPRYCRDGTWRTAALDPLPAIRARRPRRKPAGRRPACRRAA